MWARYSSAQFDQGAGRHACNNPYNRAIDEELFASMQKSKIWSVPHAKFLDMIKPSFLAVDEDEDMDAILARTHLVLLTDSGVYYRVAGTSKDPVDFIEWGTDPKDLLAPSQHTILKQYKMNPHLHKYPQQYFGDLAWSQELLRRVLNGESIPRSSTVLGSSLFGVHAERTVSAFRP